MPCPHTSLQDGALVNHIRVRKAIHHQGSMYYTFSGPSTRTVWNDWPYRLQWLALQWLALLSSVPRIIGTGTPLHDNNVIAQEEPGHVLLRVCKIHDNIHTTNFSSIQSYNHLIKYSCLHTGNIEWCMLSLLWNLYNFGRLGSELHLLWSRLLHSLYRSEPYKKIEEHCIHRCLN